MDITYDSPRVKRVAQPPSQSARKRARSIRERVQQSLLQSSAMVYDGLREATIDGLAVTGGVLAAATEGPGAGIGTAQAVRGIGENVVPTSAQLGRAAHWVNQHGPTPPSAQGMFRRIRDRLTGGNTPTGRMPPRKGTAKKASGTRRQASKQYGRMKLVRGPTFAPEKKHFDVYNSQLVAGNGIWSVHTTNQCTPVQGTAFTNRIGSRIRVTSMEFLYQSLITLANVPVTGSQVMLEFYKDNETKGVEAAIGAIKDTSVANSCVSPRDASQLKRFTYLGGAKMDVNVAATAAGATTGANTHDMAKLTFKVDQTMNFTGNAGTVADILDKSIIPIHCNCTTAAAGYITLNTVTRYWYYDT